MPPTKFSMSITSETDSLSLSRYRAPSETPFHLQQQQHQYEMDAKNVPHKVDYKMQAGGGGASPPVGKPNELQSMFVRHQYTPTPISALFTLAGLGVGIGIGILLSKLEASDDVVHWIALPGELYLNALLCAVVPGVFCSIIVAVAELVANSTVRKIAFRTALWFAISALLAAAVGTLFAALFASTFSEKIATIELTKAPKLTFQCGAGANDYLTMGQNGSIWCSSPAAGSTDGTLFTVAQADSFFVRKANEYKLLTLTDQVVGILSSMVPSNLLAGFVTGGNVSVVFSGFFFAIACTLGHDATSGEPNYLILLISQGGALFHMLINVLLKLLPMAVVSIIAGSIGTNKSQIDALQDVVYLALALCAASVTFIVVVMGSALFVTTKRNVFSYLTHLLPAQAFVVGSSSTMVTLPMTIRCVDATGEVPRGVARVVLPFGATCNMVGSSLYIPLACVFLAKISGLGDELTASKYLLLMLMSAVACFGSAPAPNSELVMLITVWRAVFHVEVGPLFATLVATDWLLGRVRALVNVTTHAILARIIAEQCSDPNLFKNTADFLDDDAVETHPRLYVPNDF